LTEAVPGQIEQNFRIMVLVQEKIKEKQRISDSNYFFCLSPLPKKTTGKLTNNFSPISQQ